MESAASDSFADELVLAYARDAAFVVSIAPALFVFGFLIEAWSHVNSGPGWLAALHLSLAGLVLVLLVVERAGRLRAPVGGVLLLWAVMHISLLAHLGQSPSDPSEMVRVVMAVLVIGTGALILPTVAGAVTLLLSCSLLLFVFVQHAPGGLLSSLSVPVLVVSVALLIRMARRWGIRQRVLRLALGRELDAERLQRMASKAGAETAARLGSGFAHHFNNQLQVMLMGADGAASLLGKDHPATTFLEAIRSSTRRAAEMTDHLLSYTSDRALSKTLFDAERLIDDLNERDVIDDAAQLTGTVAPVRLYADREQLGLALAELVLNACQAAPAGGARIAVSIAVEDDWISLRVRDNGQGFRPEIIETAKEPFVTGDSVARFGLGLAIVDMVARRHGGSFAIDSTGAEGSEVCMRIRAGEDVYREEVLRRTAPAYEL